VNVDERFCGAAGKAKDNDQIPKPFTAFETARKKWMHHYECKDPQPEKNDQAWAGVLKALKLEK
jgi:hypothetical protein